MNDEEMKRKMRADMAAAAQRQWQAGGYGGLGAMGGSGQQEAFRQACGGGAGDYNAAHRAGMDGSPLTAEKIREAEREMRRFQGRAHGKVLAQRIVEVCRQTAVTPRLRAQLKQGAMKIVAEKAGQDPVLLGAMADGVRDYLNNHNIPVRF